jgi:hypothetical protein
MHSGVVPPLGKSGGKKRDPEWPVVLALRGRASLLVDLERVPTTSSDEEYRLGVGCERHTCWQVSGLRSLARRLRLLFSASCEHEESREEHGQEEGPEEATG